MKADRIDIVVTWPKTKPLASYLADLKQAMAEDLVINYRVSRPPVWKNAVADHEVIGWPYGTRCPRCYMVHDGAIRGYLSILYYCWRAEGEVAGWPAGWYIVRSPVWHELPMSIPMKGFQGWRWIVPGTTLHDSLGEFE